MKIIVIPSVDNLKKEKICSICINFKSDSNQSRLNFSEVEYRKENDAFSKPVLH